MSEQLSRADVEQARLAQAVAASATARSNKPRFLLFLAIGLLVIAAAYTVSASSSLAAARSAVRSQGQQAGAVAELVARYLELKDTRQEDVFPTSTDTAAKLENLAGSLELLKPVVVRQGQARPITGAPGVVSREFTTMLRSVEPQAILEFLNQSTSGEVVPGLELYEVKLRPKERLQTSADGTAATAGWEADIVFTRLERSN